MSDLPDFLLARIATDEEWARTKPPREVAAGDPPLGALPDDRDRILAECAAKRLIVEDYLAQLNSHRSGWDARTPRDYQLRALALPYAAHRDYLEGWRI